MSDPVVCLFEIRSAAGKRALCHVSDDFRVLSCQSFVFCGWLSRRHASWLKARHPLLIAHVKQEFWSPFAHFQNAARQRGERSDAAAWAELPAREKSRYEAFCQGDKENSSFGRVGLICSVLAQFFFPS